VSEYQFYEFRAIDRPLTEQEMAEVRTLSTRAEITRTKFVNVYHYGDFKGDPLELTKRYYDAHVYIANWGTHEFMLRLPRTLLDPEVAQRYCAPNSGCAEAHFTNDHVVLVFNSQDEGEAGWVDDEESEGWLPALLPLREEIASGDLRALYLGWLCCAQAGFLDGDAVEPPVPPGLGKPTPALELFIDFLRIEENLVVVAAERSAPLERAKPAPPQLEQWLGEGRFPSFAGIE
jgi:hypothetical protein